MLAGEDTSAKMPDGFNRPLPSSIRDASTVSESTFEIARCLHAGSRPKKRGLRPPVPCSSTYVSVPLALSMLSRTMLLCPTLATYSHFADLCTHNSAAVL